MTSGAPGGPQSFRRIVAALLASLLLVPLAGRPRAEFLGSDAAATGARELRAELATVLMREEARRELSRLGVSPKEAAERLAALSDAELSLIARHLPSSAAGQGVGSVWFGLLFGIPAGFIVSFWVLMLVGQLLDDIRLPRQWP